jgi:GntR family transcriptional regulator
VNANTVAKVYSHLERVGALETRRGVGTFVTAVDQSRHNDEARETELRAIATRALTEASAKGFSAADLRRALTSLTKGASS